MQNTHEADYPVLYNISFVRLLNNADSFRPLILVIIL